MSVLFCVFCKGPFDGQLSVGLLHYVICPCSNRMAFNDIEQIFYRSQLVSSAASYISLTVLSVSVLFGYSGITRCARTAGLRNSMLDDLSTASARLLAGRLLSKKRTVAVVLPLSTISLVD